MVTGNDICMSRANLALGNVHVHSYSGVGINQNGFRRHSSSGARDLLDGGKNQTTLNGIYRTFPSTMALICGACTILTIVTVLFPT